MARLVADSSAIILLAKCGLLEIVCDLYDVLVPTAVRLEVASPDLARSYPDAALISELVSKGAVEVQDPGSDRPPLPLSLHKGEEEALSLAMNLGKPLFAADDGKAIKAARFLNVPFIITPKIVVELFGLRKITLKRARECLEKLGKIGRYSPEIIADALISLMEKEDGKANDHKNT
jgi:predicted nucleic acid-binding protein